MSFRSRLMLAMAPLLLALGAVGVVSGMVASVLAHQPGHIWKDNYRSVLAAQRMKDAVASIEQAALFELLEPGARPDSMQAGVGRFERELAAEARNVTESGETEAVARLRGDWQAYLRALASFHRERDPSRRRTLYLGPLSDAFGKVSRAADEILNINQDAVVRRGERTERRAASFERVLTLAVLLASVLGLLASVSLTRRLLRPLAVVSAAVRRFGQGDGQARARIGGDDDIAQLAREFNTMADSLERYRKSSLGELLQAQQASQAAIDSLPDPVLMLDAAGNLQTSNEGARVSLGIDPEGSGGAALARVDPGVRSLLDRLRAHVVGGRGAYHPKGFEDALRVATPDGERIFLPRATPIYGEAGAIAGAALVLQDITRLFHFDELKNNLVATVAHEFRTPLTSLRMALHLCTEEVVGPLSSKQADLLFAAREDCERLQAIVDDLLDLSRLESGRIELQRRRIEAKSLVDPALEVHAAAAEARRVVLRAQVEPGLPEAFADPDRIQLVFTNLLTNAIRHAPPESEILLRALPDPEAPGAAGEQGFLRFEVHDRGPGIPVEHQAGLFEKFFRVPGSPAGGAGLGLFIARGIVQAHGGRIGVSSQPGRGATFWFTISAAADTAAQA